PPRDVGHAGGAGGVAAPRRRRARALGRRRRSRGRRARGVPPLRGRDPRAAHRPPPGARRSPRVSVPRRRPATTALATGFTVLLLLLATATAGGAQTGAPRPATGGVSATSIKVAGLGDAFVYGGADVGAKARFQRANDAGGVHGRTIDYAGFTDDGGDP